LIALFHLGPRPGRFGSNIRNRLVALIPNGLAS
jgi:hypothetical protein